MDYSEVMTVITAAAANPLRTLREERGLSQSDLARLVGSHPSVISRAEAVQLGPDLAARIAIALEVEVEQLA